MKRTRQYSPRVRKALEEKGYFAMPRKERQQETKRNMDQLFGSGKGDLKAGYKALLEARGDINR